jgi:hypothetical protein
MTRSRRPYGKVVQRQELLPSKTNKDAHAADDDASKRNHDQQDKMYTRNISSNNEVLPVDLSTGAPSSNHESTTSTAVQKGIETMQRRQERGRKRRKAPLRETTNIHPHHKVSSKRKNNSFPSSDAIKIKQSSGDEITPRASNCNKIKQQKRSFDETKYCSQYVPSSSPDKEIISPARKQMADTATEMVKERQHEVRGHESECSGMDCSSDSLGLESSNDVKKGNKEIVNEQMSSDACLDVSKPSLLLADGRIFRESQSNNKNALSTVDAEKLYPDSDLVDSNGCPMVSKGLMKRALTSEPDNESVLKVLMSSCGGRNRKRAKSKIPSSASSVHSDLTLGSSTLLGATIPLKRCDSFDSTLTFDSYGKCERGYDAEVEEPNFQHVTERRVQRGLKTTPRPSHAISEQSTDFPPSGLPSVHQNKTNKDCNENDGKAHISTTKKVTQSHEQHRNKRESENDDGTVNTIDSENKSVVIHPKLPPGWRVKVSRSKKQVYYVHPDFGSTWHCPVVTQKPVLIKKYQIQKESPGNDFHEQSMKENDEAKSMPKVSEKDPSHEIHEVNLFDTEKGEAGANNRQPHSLSFENDYICSDQMEIVLSHQHQRKFAIYEDPVIENAPVVDAVKEHATNYNHSQLEEKSQLQLLHQERRNDKVNNTNTGETNPTLQDNGTRENIAGSTIHRKTGQSSWKHNESVMSEESSISNVDSSPRYLDFSNEAEVDNFDENNSDTSHDYQNSEKSSDESMPQRNYSGGQSSNILVASSSWDVSDSIENEIHQQEIDHENIQSKRETLAERLARLHHPLCSLQRLDDIIRGKKIRKSPKLHHSRSKNYKGRRLDKIRVSYGEGRKIT